MVRRRHRGDHRHGLLRRVSPGSSGVRSRWRLYAAVTKYRTRRDVDRRRDRGVARRVSVLHRMVHRMTQESVLNRVLLLAVVVAMLAPTITRAAAEQQPAQSAKQPATQTCTLKVSGMTCASCDVAV